jgi:ankyrin repeat protein
VNQAAKLGNVSMVRALVEAGAGPNHGAFNGGDTALMQAASQGHLR